jgi:hypothetical protein
VGIVIVGLGHGGTPLLLCSDFGIFSLFYRVCRISRGSQTAL